MTAAAASKTTQDKPTRPQPVDRHGRTLDRHGLPLNGPARIAALAGKPDPALALPTAAADAAPTEQQD